MDTKKSKKQRRMSDSSLSSEHESEEKPNVLKKKKYTSFYDSDEEARLERAVFGDANDIVQNLLSEDELETGVKEENSLLEPKSDESDSDHEIHNSDSDSEAEDGSEKEDYDTDDCDSVKKKKAWLDEDDEKYSVLDAFKAQNRKLSRSGPEKKYTQLLNKKFTEVYGKPKWAELNKEKEVASDESDSEILKHSNHKATPKAKKLRKGVIELKALTDMNRKTHKEGPFVSSIQFHPTSTVSLVAGSSGILSLFEVDGKENNKLTTMKFERFPISTARFLNDGMEIVVGSLSHSHCFTYDLIKGGTSKIPLPHGITNMKKFEISPDGKYIAVCGRLGDIFILSSVTKELIHSFKMNKKCSGLAFSPDSQKLFTNGACSEMYVWDMRSLRCIHRPIDDGCLSAASMAMSSSGQFLATGSKQGVVNIYDTNTVLQDKSPKPLKTILNLVTSITSLKFNPTSEILAFASSKKANAFKMAHLPSFTIFSNFPTFQTKMYNPLAIDFSPNSGFLGVSNNKGHAYLYRLKHYGNY